MGRAPERAVAGVRADRGCDHGGGNGPPYRGAVWLGRSALGNWAVLESRLIRSGHAPAAIRNLTPRALCNLSLLHAYETCSNDEDLAEIEEIVGGWVVEEDGDVVDAGSRLADLAAVFNGDMEVMVDEREDR